MLGERIDLHASTVSGHWRRVEGTVCRRYSREHWWRGLPVRGTVENIGGGPGLPVRGTVENIGGGDYLSEVQ